MDVLEWLERWYLKQCNGDWEHRYGISITNIDNPGWEVTIPLIDTSADGMTVEPIIEVRGDTDWVRCEIQDGVFVAYGDPIKLRFILELFRSLVTADEV